MFPLPHPFIHTLEPFFIPVCFVVAWTLMILFPLSLGSAIRDTVTQARQMHQIPCTHCRYFTNDHRLKCPVQPKIANTEKAIDCSDYRRSY